MPRRPANLAHRPVPGSVIRIFVWSLLLAPAALVAAGDDDGPTTAPAVESDAPAAATPGPPGPEPIVLDEPVRARFRLADGVTVTGDLTQWSADEFDGTFGRRRWVELMTTEAWGLHRRVMDPAAASHWINLGRIMLLMPRGERRAEQAFRHALRLAPEEAPAAVDAARAAAAETIRGREEAAAAAEAERLRTTPPEAAPWRPDPWPALDPDEQAGAVATMRADATRILDEAGVRLDPVETDYFLFYSDLPRRESARWALELDRMYRRVAKIFSLDEGSNIFWGKAVIFVFTEQDTFRLVEAQAFNQLATRATAGLCHTIGPKVFINFFRQPDELDFAAILVHETVHGIMHRFRTPRRLPTWANEGLADYIASITFDRSPVDQARRDQGLAFIRGGGNVATILDMQYTDGTWPGPDGVGYAVGYLLVELMIREKPRDFGRWVEAVKGGADWEAALEEVFGVSRKTLTERFVRYSMVND